MGIVDTKPTVPVAFPESLNHRLTEARHTLQQHASRVLDGDALSALHFVSTIVEAAVRAQVFGQVYKACQTNTNTNPVTAREGMRAYAEGRVRALASRGAVKSTNPLDAAIHAEELSAWYDVEEAFRS